MHIEFLLDVFERNKDKDAVVWKDKVYDYGWMLKRVLHWREVVKSEGVPPGSVVVLEADFSPNTIALFLALVDRSCILVPLTSAAATKREEFTEIAQGEFYFLAAKSDSVKVSRLSHSASHPVYKTLKERGRPGLILFSSGSTGASKGAVHDLTGLLEKFKIAKQSLRTITFLQFDHIGGVNTMLYTLSNAGCIVTIQDRSTDSVLKAVEKYKVDLLPTSPTFMNLILLSEAYKRHDLGSLKMITYGTEPMQESTLRQFHLLFPDIRLQQTYGLSEMGILRSKSKSSDSLWVKIGGPEFQLRVVDGLLQIKGQSAMLGYLNAPSPFTEDGWFMTGDMVEVDGEYMKILGRESELIIVGGEKVHPAEVESVIQEIENVAEVSVYGEKNPITGSIVCASVSLKKAEDAQGAAARIREFCRGRMQKYKVPMKIRIVEAALHNDRFKKSRKLA